MIVQILAKCFERYNVIALFYGNMTWPMHLFKMANSNIGARCSIGNVRRISMCRLFALQSKTISIIYILTVSAYERYYYAEVCILILLAHLLSGTRIANAPIPQHLCANADIISLERLRQRMAFKVRCHKKR